MEVPYMGVGWPAMNHSIKGDLPGTPMDMGPPLWEPYKRDPYL